MRRAVRDVLRACFPRGIGSVDPLGTLSEYMSANPPMSMFTLLMLLTAGAVLALVLVLVYFLIRIIAVLERIGGTPTSYLARLRLGLRAIERETDHLPERVPKVNRTLQDVNEGLGVVRQHLAGTIEAVTEQDAGEES